ncbi:PepSY domain-containing protein, partial [Rathayibacter sp. VKM Ac-2630]|uniref:PepSY domain-containing protein n=1 Tax=Rathayibacter sp. VKM Ac-2630 TaxID=1938617 RepID=UPI0009D29EF7
RRPASGAVDPDDLTGDDLARASEAALAAVGGGTVTEAERSDDADHAFDLEVTREDGTDVDVDLDADFAVVATND